MNISTWLFASLIFDSIRQLKNNLYTNEIGYPGVYLFFIVAACYWVHNFFC